MKDKIFPGQHAEEIVNELLMEAAGIAARAYGLHAVNQHDLCGSGGDHTHRHLRNPGAGKGFAEQLPWFDPGDDASVSQIIRTI